MKGYVKEPTMAEKFGYSLYAGLIYLIVAAPITYKTVRSVFNAISPALGNLISDAKGLATQGGLVVHAIVFTLIVFLSMILLDYFKDVEEGIFNMTPKKAIGVAL